MHPFKLAMLHILEKLYRAYVETIYQLKILKHRPKLGWNRLWVRKNEFHSSLDMDIRVLADLNERDRKQYILDLVRRREIAHERDLAH